MITESGISRYCPMFGANPPRPRTQEPRDSLLLQGAPFDTIQGEGPLAGMPATFIRLWGCHLQCWFCDTDFESAQLDTTIEALVTRCMASTAAPLVVLTGGEPMRQYIPVLCALLLARGKLVQIETAGSFWFEESPLWLDVIGHPAFTLVVSPKTPAVNPTLAYRAHAWKYIISADYVLGEDGLPIGNTQQKDGKLRKLARPPLGTDHARVFLQPMDQYSKDKNAANTALCVELAQRHGYRISMQLHKQWGLP